MNRFSGRIFNHIGKFYKEKKKGIYYLPILEKKEKGHMLGEGTPGI